LAKFSAQQVYSLLSEHQLTAEQRAAIEDASISSPALVVAGAGSGKTELMTVRVLWLIANSIAKPGEILGLTFTRKAASELQGRIQGALYKMRESELWPAELEFDFDPPKIATYNSFGNEIFRELALAVGLETDAALLGEAASYQLVRELIQKRGFEIDPNILDWDKTIDYLSEAVLNLASATTDHFRFPGEAKSQFESLGEFLATLPKNEKGLAGQFDYTLKYLDAIKSSALAAALADAYIEEKRKRNLVDFSDQVALAVRAIEEFGKQGIAQQYRFVMLDEYQDTSAIQTRMLAGLFANQAVMAVGDPNQAIYGWRGASSANLSSFAKDFGGDQVFPLSTSWRSGQAIVEAANLIAQPLATPAQFESTAALRPIKLAAAQNAKRSEVFIQIKSDEQSEAMAIANWFLPRISPETSGAILVRTKSSMRLLASALEAAGLQVEVTGLGGLLETPEIVDLVAALKVIQRPEAGTELMRVLAGPKYRLSVRDIAELSKLSKKLTRIRKEVSSTQPITLVETLDELLRESTAEMYGGSEIGLSRLRDAAKLFRKMRSQTGMSLSAFAEAVAKELLLDIELLSIPNLKNPLGHLDEFYQRIEEFEVFADRPSLEGFLTWLDYAKDKERFEAPKSGSKKGVIQILTMHSSKGLEWDFVAIPQVVKNSFPNQNKESNGWISFGQLPWNLRSDSDSLPKWQWSKVQNQQEFKKSHEAYKEEVAIRHLREETRLAYVAFTRAKRELLVSASWYKRGGSTPREPSSYLLDLKPIATALELVESAPETNPLDKEVIERTWPINPGPRQPGVKDAAELVKAQSPSEINGEFQLLLDELDQNRSFSPPPLPSRLSASAFSALHSDAASFSERISRPVPSLFSDQAETGSKFHATLESAFRSGNEIDFEPFLEEKPEADVLVKAFQSSRFANQTAQFAELEIQFPIAGFVIVCKLDAVFKTESGFEIVDWKTGSSPKNEAEVNAKSVQLALYRIALSKYLNIGIEKIQTSFFFVGDSKEITPTRLITEIEITEFLESLRTDRRT
jgi:DNA helicase-2/ATP-dependent DNA helicase PcrA